MMTVGSRASVSTLQGVGFNPTGHTFAPTRRVGLSTLPFATDPVSTTISESLSHFGSAADFCSNSVSSFLKSSRSPSGSKSGSFNSSRRRPAGADGVAEGSDGLGAEGDGLGGVYARIRVLAQTRQKHQRADVLESSIAVQFRQLGPEFVGPASSAAAKAGCPGRTRALPR